MSLDLPESSSPAPSLGAMEGAESLPKPPPASISDKGNFEGASSGHRAGNYAHKKLQARHHRMAELVVQGKSNKYISEELGMHQSSVSLNINSPLVQAQIASLRQGRAEVIHQQAIAMKELAPQAMDLYRKYIDQDNDELAPRDKARLAGDIFDRAGIAKKTETESTKTHIFITAEELEGIQQRASESPKYVPCETVETLEDTETT